MKFKTILLPTLLLLLSVTALSQQVEINAFKVDQHDFISKLIEWRKANPKATALEFATKAEEKFNKYGLNFSFLLDSNSCNKISELKRQQKDKSKPLELGGSLRSVDGDSAALSFPEPMFNVSECGACELSFSTLEITEHDFISVVEGQNVKFYLPPNLIPNIANLVDKDDHNKTLQTFRIPFRSKPIGISHDSTVLYLEFDHAELNDLSLLVYNSGGFRIGTRADAEEGGKGVELKTDQSAYNLIRFDRWENSYLIKYKMPCKN